MNILYYILIAIIIINLFVFNYLYTYTKTFYHHTEPLKEHTLQVSGLHTIYYSEHGNRNGKPVLFVHGGPGYPPIKGAHRFFHPDKYYIITVHQRGCGKSRPIAELRENTTQHLIEDFEKIRNKLNIQKWMLFGGSWGSTLSLAYAITYPDVVSELVIKGVFLATQDEVDWLYSSSGAPNIFPESWNYFIGAFPNKTNKSDNYLDEYGKCFNGDYGNEKRKDCLHRWSVWESSLKNLQVNNLNDIVEKEKNEEDKHEYEAGPIIEHHYIRNNCFLEPGFFFKTENINKIKHIPTVIVQGRYDIICPIDSAYKLHKLLPKSKLYITMAGHSSLDDENISANIDATDSFLQ